MSDTMDPSKLKVAELRAELQSRSLDTKGNKPVLVERLKEALEAEAAGHDGFNESVGRPANDAVKEEEEEEEEEEPQPEVEEEAESEPADDSGAAEVKDEPEDSSKFGYEEAPVEVDSEGSHANDAVEGEEEEEEEEEEKDEEAQQEEKEAEQEEEDEEVQQDLEEKMETKATDDPEEVDVKEEPEDSSKSGYEEAPVEVDVKTEQDNGLEMEVKEEVAEVKQEVKEESVETAEAAEGKRRGEKRPRSRSRSPETAPEAKKSRPEVEEVRIEDEPDIDKTIVALDWYNSDLSLVISKDDFLSAQPLTMQGFGYVWHGVRATYGFTHGRVWFEVKVEDYLPVPQLEEEEQHPHVLRAGWSVNDAGLTLGEDPLSYGYGGTGKASTNLRFKDYGKQFGKGDVLGCFLDLEAEPIVMSFTVNGQHQGIAYEIRQDELQGQPLFPHIATKNTSFRVNFGTQDPWFPPLTDFTPVGQIPLEERVLGTQGPEKREDSEIIMMVGLPGAGKTTWVEKYIKENLEKKYYVLGTNFLIDKMKVNGLPRRRNYTGRWEVLIERCTKCLNKLLELSYKRRRNFIIDQTNVYPSAQRRKMKGFAGFKRRAVVICPSDEDLKKRTEKREREEGKDIPDKAVLEMKANFKLPEEGEIFDKVDFVEMTHEDGLKLVEQYNKEGEDAGFGQKKGFRGGCGERRGGFMDRRGGYGNRGGSFRGGWDRDRRGGYNDRRERSSWSRDRDSRDYNRSGSYNREGRGSFNRDYNRGSYNNRDSRGGYNRDRGSRSGNYQNNWNRNSQGSQGGQGYGNYSNYNNQGSWGNQGYGYNQGYSNNTWNQQYYQQQQQQPQQQQQQPPQQYWGTGYGYGNQGYGTNQQYGANAQSTPQSGNWGQQSNSWSGAGQQWGSAYNKQQWGGTGYGSGNQSNQRR